MTEPHESADYSQDLDDLEADTPRRGAPVALYVNGATGDMISPSGASAMRRS